MHGPCMQGMHGGCATVRGMQDRCHRIGQTREVHIYRLISEHTIEENILRKSNQKRHLDHLAIQSGGFSGSAAAASAAASGKKSLASSDVRDLLGADLLGAAPPKIDKISDEDYKKAIAQAEDAADAAAAAEAEAEVAEENAADFDENAAEGGGGKGVGEGGGSGEGGAGGAAGTGKASESGPAVLKATAVEAQTMLRPIEKYAVRVRPGRAFVREQLLCAPKPMCVLCVAMHGLVWLA